MEKLMEKQCGERAALPLADFNAEHHISSGQMPHIRLMPVTDPV